MNYVITQHNRFHFVTETIFQLIFTKTQIKVCIEYFLIVPFFHWEALFHYTVHIFLFFPISQYIQGVTGPHRQNDRDDRPCREDNFCEGTYTRKHVIPELCACIKLRAPRTGTN